MPQKSQRIDVIVQTNRIIEMFSRAQGASVKEVCRELEINERTFYRRIDDLEKMDIPLFTKADPDAATSGKRWYVQDGYQNEVRLFLTPAEKMLLRQLVYKAFPGNQIEKSLSEKINEAVLHDANSVNFAITENQLEQKEVIKDEDSFKKISKAIELKKRINFGGINSSDAFGIPKDVKFFFKDCSFEPYSFISHGFRSYLFGKVISKAGEFITGVHVNSMGIITILDEKFSVPDDYSVDELIKKWLCSSKVTHIKLSVDHKLADMITYQKWFDHICVEWYFDRRIIEFDTNQLEDAVQLFLSLGSAVKVLEPRSLVKRMKREVDKTALQYSNRRLPPCAYKHRVVIRPGKFERESCISLGRHTTNYALYELYPDWWRQILRLENPQATELLRLSDSKDGLPMYPMKLLFEMTGPASHRVIPLSAIGYRDRILLEYPMLREITGNLESLTDAFDKPYGFISDWWHDDDKCKMRWLFRNVLNIPEDERWAPYKKNPPIALITGIDYIDEKIARELNENGTVLGHIPAVAIVFRHTPDADGTDTVTCNVYGKDLPV